MFKYGKILRLFSLVSSPGYAVSFRKRLISTSKEIYGTMTKDVRIISIQSHVVHGYVGNKCAVFPLQLSGFEVDAINSVQFSNHTGYGKWTGEVLSSQQLWKLYEGLCENSLNEYSHILTGYTSSASCLKEIARIVTDLRKKNPGLRYICDPVMGDNGKFYVSEDVVPIYRDVIIPLANVVTPNQFELELLSGISVSNENDVLQAMAVLHGRGVKTVVVTSMNNNENENSLVGYGSQLETENQMEIFRFDIPRLEGYYVGTGDIFASLILLWLQKTANDLKESLENVLSSLQAILKRTLEHARSQHPTGKLTSKDLELRLIQSKDDLLSPRSILAVSQLKSRQI